jgi:hypothetical protein
MAWAWLKEFAEAVCQDRQPQVIPDDILAAIEVVDAFKRSLTTGCRERVGM